MVNSRIIQDHGGSGGDQRKSQRSETLGTNANSPTAERAARVNPKSSANGGVDASKAQSSLGGSRFSHLQDMETDEAEELEVVVMDENKERTGMETAQKEPGIMEVKQKGKKKI